MASVAFLSANGRAVNGRSWLWPMYPLALCLAAWTGLHRPELAARLSPRIPGWLLPSAPDPVLHVDLNSSVGVDRFAPSTSSAAHGLAAGPDTTTHVSDEDRAGCARLLNLSRPLTEVELRAVSLWLLNRSASPLLDGAGGGLSVLARRGWLTWMNLLVAGLVLWLLSSVFGFVGWLVDVCDRCLPCLRRIGLHLWEFVCSISDALTVTVTVLLMCAGLHLSAAGNSLAGFWIAATAAGVAHVHSFYLLMSNRDLDNPSGESTTIFGWTTAVWVCVFALAYTAPMALQHRSDLFAVATVGMLGWCVHDSSLVAIVCHELDIDRFVPDHQALVASGILSLVGNAVMLLPFATASIGGAASIAQRFSLAVSLFATLPMLVALSSSARVESRRRPPPRYVMRILEFVCAVVLAVVGWWMRWLAWRLRAGAFVALMLALSVWESFPSLRKPLHFLSAAALLAACLYSTQHDDLLLAFLRG